MGRSDGCDGLGAFSTLVWYSFLSLAHFTNNQQLKTFRYSPRIFCRLLFICLFKRSIALGVGVGLGLGIGLGLVLGLGLGVGLALGLG